MIGTVLLVSITVLLAATTAAFVFGFGPDSGETQAPNVALDFEYEYAESGVDTLKITQAGGDTTTAKNLYVIVDGASAPPSANPGTPDGQYDFHSLNSGLGSTSDVAAGTSITLGANLVSGTPPEIDFSSATVSVNWNNPNTGESIQLATWTGPDA